LQDQKNIVEIGQSLYASGILGVYEIFSMDFNLNVPGRLVTRKVFSALDWLSEVGGMFGSISMFVSFAISLYNPQVFRIEAVKSNFRIRPEREETEQLRRDLTKVE
jgi:hypothetical protein